MNPPKNENSALAAIISAFLAGDASQIGAIRKRVTQYVAGRTAGSKLDAEEIVAEVIAALTEGLVKDRFRGGTLRELNAYIYGITRVKILQAVDCNRRSPLTSTPEHTDAIPAPDRHNPHDTVSDRDLVQKIYDALDHKCCELLRLKYEDGWNDQEIADFKGMSKNAVSTAISRCVQKARQIRAVRENMYQKPMEDD